MQTIRDASGFVSQWVAEKSKSQVPEGAVSFGFVDDDGHLVGGLSFTERDWQSCSITIAATSPRWCTKENLTMMFSTVFDEWGIKYLYTLTPDDNSRAKKLAEGMGFKPDGKLRRLGPNGDDVNLFGMLREDCPFLNEVFAHG